MNRLIVEDNFKIRRMIRSIVADSADPIDECDSGGEAFELFLQNPPGWVLMDIHLKKINGIEAAKQITSIIHDAKIIIATNCDATCIFWNRLVRRARLIIF